MKFKLRLIKNDQVLIQAHLKGQSFKVAISDIGARTRSFRNSMCVLDALEGRSKVILIESGSVQPFEVLGRNRFKYLQFINKLIDFAERKLEK